LTEKRQYQKSFPLLAHGKNLLKVFATIGGNNGDVSEYRISLLVDTGSTYTILPTMPLKDLGYNLENPTSFEKIITGKGQIYVPIIKVSWFNCVGKFIKNFTALFK
jgi:aspartyl protease family protein